MIQRHHLTEFVGKTFGRLTVTGLTAEISTSNKKLWSFTCECGQNITAVLSNVISGNTKSCGCQNTEATTAMGKQNTRPDAGLGCLFSRYKSSGGRRNLSFSLTREEFALLTSSACHYCGCLPFKKANSVHAKVEYLYNGIDRVDNNKGYDPDNCVSCCFVCNRAKHVMSHNEFMVWIARLIQHQSKDPRGKFL